VLNIDINNNNNNSMFCLVELLLFSYYVTWLGDR